MEIKNITFSESIRRLYAKKKYKFSLEAFKVSILANNNVSVGDIGSDSIPVGGSSES